MNPGNQAAHARVKYRIFKKSTSPAEVVSVCDKIVAAGSQSPDIAADPMAQSALADLKAAVDALRTTLAASQAAKQGHLTATKALATDRRGARQGIHLYLASVNHLAKGDAAIITGAGCQVKMLGQPGVVQMPAKVLSQPGKAWSEALVYWSRAPGAVAYACQVNFTPDKPDAWISLPSTTGRKRVIKAPAPGAKFLVRIASIGSTQSDWTIPITATAL